MGVNPLGHMEVRPPYVELRKTAFINNDSDKCKHQSKDEEDESIREAWQALGGNEDEESDDGPDAVV